MQTLGACVMWLGLVLILLGGLFFVIAAFRESILWGLGVLFVPFVSLVFLVLNWSRAKNSFFLQLYGIGAIIVASLLLSAKFPIILH
ncbi:MAG TPA: hypothetical protein VFQ53_40470 [Kofleriaceae bacterium]|nr:hypothetical protein [Kofleriaceae bacterium]